jgi:hypothetical protein
VLPLDARRTAPLPPDAAARRVAVGRLRTPRRPAAALLRQSAGCSKVSDYEEGDVRVTTALCATRRHQSSGDERTPPPGCRSSLVEAEGSRIPEARVRAGAALTKARWAGTTGRSSARSARRKGVTEVNQWLNPLKSDAGSNLVDVGRSAAHAVRDARGRGLRSRPNAVGGEAARKACGVLVAMLQGEELGADPVDRDVVNVGTVPVPPSPPPVAGGGGQARCRLTAPGRGGGSVVVRAGESPAHGEGTQRASRAVAGRPGGRR